MTFTVLAAPNAFKESLTAGQASRAMEKGILKASPQAQVIRLPVADGGDGLIDALKAVMGGSILTRKVADPRQQEVDARILMLEDKGLAVIEMAEASGLHLVPDAMRDPTRTTTFGTGQLIRYALDEGAKDILLGIGGSATCDGGMGVAAALGYKFLDRKGNLLEPVGASLASVVAIDVTTADPRIRQTAFSVACDVTNPLTGPKGASYVFSPQKGASREQVADLDRGLLNFAKVLEKTFGTPVDALPGAGAAGGLGAGMRVFFDATLSPGIDLVLQFLDFDKALEKADLVMTAEGRMDAQTRFNKAPAGVAKAARAAGIPCIALCGSKTSDIQSLHEIGIAAVLSIVPGPISLKEAMEEAGPLLTDAAEQAVRLFLAAGDTPDQSG